ncbi:MAG TPA: acyltransferase family protein [Polaromonas sp.]|uniref:acyltransferase family protein n=1 Tax=Polaromonas sp. TaxID=1869339 RepID=UPI002D736822|nr:acyltransferase family protein [Polaromonas sp.]HYW56839.1 acyltransferase family protein [Polaromonas sp.]
MTYRPDIDGLRAIAVLSVVFFHAGIQSFPGGFAGVDIFLVISGFLITRILIEMIEAQQFSLVNFYIRRTRRILPALYVVIVSVFLLGLFVLLPLELVGLSKSILATNLFVSNFLFWKQAGYFDAAAELKPLLHTWSLAVEEQFYVVWPLLLALSYRRGWRLKWIVVTLLVLSFAAAGLLLVETPDAVFYLLPFRAWELLMGAALAAGYLGSIAESRWKHICSLVGLGLLLVSVFFLNKALPFPGWNALPPCLGAVLLIAAGKDAVVNRYVLSARPLVLVGLISYSLYLWHWPLLVYVRVLNLGQLPVADAIVAIGISMVLAWLTWRYIEQPFRANGEAGRPVGLLVKFALPGLLLCAAAGTALAYKGFPERIRPDVVAAQEAALDFNASRSGCHLGMANIVLPPWANCTSQRLTGTTKTGVVVWGDSHAEAIVPGVRVMSGLAESEMLQLTKTSCPPLIGAKVIRGGTEYQECETFNRKVLALLTESSAVTTVVLAARWPVYVLGAPFGAPEELPGTAGYALTIGAPNVPISITSVEVFEAALGNTVELLVRAGKKVVVVGSVPEMKFDVPACVARARMALSGGIECGLDHQAVGQRISMVDAAVDRLATRAQAVAVYPDRILCQHGYCDVEGPEGQVLYHDHNHLSTAGARFVFSKLRLKD